MLARSARFFSSRSAVMTASRSITTADMTPAERVQFGLAHSSPAVSKILTDSPFSHAKGSWVYLENGRKLLDFNCGIAVTNTGHCHPRVVEAAQTQLGKMLHGQINVGFHRPVLDLIERLLTIVPSNLSSFFFANSGSEAIENSVKIARAYTKKQNIIVFQGSFHGRTIAASALTRSKILYRIGFGPFMDGVFVAPFPYCNHCKIPKGVEECCNDSIEQIELLLKQQTAPQDTAAIMLEPVLGEGGYVFPPKSFLKKLRKICDQNNILLIVDEVQSGFGRTGKFFAIEHFLDLPSESPDIIVMSKGIASGLPLSALACKPELLQNLYPGSVGGTFGGNAVSCAAAVATIDVMKEEKILENANARGEQLRHLLGKLQQKYPEVIRDIRGLGLMNAVEFNPQKGKQAAPELSKICQQNDMILMNTSIFDTIRLMPPLTVSESEIDLGVKILTKSLETHLDNISRL